MNKSISKKTFVLLTLKMISGVGSVALWKAKSIDNIEYMPISDLLPQIVWFGQDTLPKEIDKAVDAANTIVSKAVEFGDRIISYFDNEYPNGLRDKGDKKAPLLFCRGDIGLFNQETTAVIGSRNPVGDSVEITELTVTGLVKNNNVVLSGLAEGIDTAAHKTTLSLEGKTIAVIGTALDQCYPKENAQLAFEIGKKGLIVSEIPYGEPIEKYNFVTRDFIQALISDKLILIQTGTQGGSLHATKATLFLNKPLYVASPPHSVFSDNFYGNSVLLNTDEETVKSILGLKHVDMTLIRPLSQLTTIDIGVNNG